ncbi:cadmium-translocating P-type ATPase [Bradymonadaceae bacterium TMQ3]|uniref:Cadmium-translocating P-type ATPase n=1 Tax=Lujinxingia sediminis TaxID=2480984 RepID=A0ABY0CXF4_9DELT|nr:heavy metal translocating P-type ATPase [Lujinxingia sediminis]RDV39390.1 cadmium-translocating P-type ATPase [Bradymonadaceae bacterium TMQ3]RVU48572.1 cadmium-translocating P-type ATPase [Lujinxingia sediminis]TXC77866.1 cadmium-translocating P-type ATPase [Bradymonadales bacterium TMQ1]
MTHQRNWLSQESIIAIFTVVAILTHLLFRFGPGPASVQDWPLYATLTLGGIPLIWDLLKQLRQLNFGADWLAGISIVASVLLGEYLAGSIVVLMLSGGEALERYAAGRASSVLEALAARMPNLAHRRQDDAMVDIELSEIAVGDLLVVLPHEPSPTDGEVVEGHGAMDESFLTGEPYMISKAPGAEVISGAINGEHALTIRVTRLPEDSRYARIMKVMQDSEQRRPRLRRLADQLGAYYTPLAVAMGLAAWALSGDPVRFLAVVIVATPCPLLIGIPVALIGSISLAAKRGIIIKDPRVLERASRCTTLIIDKTGTLTVGEPELTDVVVRGELSEHEVIELTASLEHYSRHPLAKAIIRASDARGLAPRFASEVSEPPGQGLTGKVDGRDIVVTSRSKLAKHNHPDLHAIPPVESGLECVILVDDRYQATLRFHDAPRHDGRPFIQHLKPRHGFNEVLLVSGDREREVAYLANLMGIERTYAEQSPEDKVEIVRKESESTQTLFVGDGVNDAPAMATATVGVAFGQAHEVTSEAAGAVLLEPTLTHLDELLHISARMRRVALQSAVGGIALSMIGMGFAAFGMLPPIAGALAQEGIDLLAVINALRTSRQGGPLSDIHTER